MCVRVTHERSKRAKGGNALATAAAAQTCTGQAAAAQSAVTYSRSTLQTQTNCPHPNDSCKGNGDSGGARSSEQLKLVLVVVEAIVGVMPLYQRVTRDA